MKQFSNLKMFLSSNLIYFCNCIAFASAFCRSSLFVPNLYCYCSRIFNVLGLSSNLKFFHLARLFHWNPNTISKYVDYDVSCWSKQYFEVFLAIPTFF